MGHPYLEGCPDANAEAGQCDDQVDEGEYAWRKWGYEGPANEEVLWIKPGIYSFVLAYPDIASVEARIEQASTDYRPRTEGTFDVAPVPNGERYTPGYRGEGTVTAFTVGGWTGLEGRSTYVVTSPAGRESLLYGHDFVAIRNGQFVIICDATDLGVKPDVDVCVEMANGIVQKLALE